MLLEINIKEVWKPKNLSYINNKLKVMVLLITYYLIVGLVISFGIEHIIRWTNQDVSHGERFQMIVLWPIMTIVFVYNFLKGMFGS